ncbi:MAG: hypothetical protein KQH57_17785 [Actinomycetales bacterium]|nr:hypothetical protein [Actinomycetales bacterium]
MTNPTAATAAPTPVRPVPARNRALRAVVRVVAAFQLVLGAAFLVAPGATASALGLAPAPGWTNWLFAMMAARFLGYGVGMLAVARDPGRHRLWLDTMIGIQVVDWVATAGHLAARDVTFAQVSTAAFLPVVFVAAMLALRLRLPREGARR